MKQLVIPRYGPPEVLTVREVPDPPVIPGTVRIRVKAAGVNFSDLLARQGLYPDAPKPPCTIGYEVAGVVEDVGDGVTVPWRGEQVVAMTRFGGQSELGGVPASSVFPLPDGWSAEQGGALPGVYLTAHHMLVRGAGGRQGGKGQGHPAGGGGGGGSAGVRRLLRFPRFGPVGLMNDNKSVAGVSLGHLWKEQALLHPQVEALLGYAREGKLAPRVDRAFPLSEAAAAHRYIHERRNVGKVVLVM